MHNIYTYLNFTWNALICVKILSISWLVKENYPHRIGLVAIILRLSAFLWLRFESWAGDVYLGLGSLDYQFYRWMPVV